MYVYVTVAMLDAFVIYVHRGIVYIDFLSILIDMKDRFT